MKSFLKTALFAAAVLAVTGSANAALIGNNVDFSIHYPGANGDIYGDASGMISDGTALGPIYGNASVATFHPDSIDFTQSTDYIPNVYYVISGTGLNITGVNGIGIDASRVSFDANDIYLNVGANANGVYQGDFSVQVQMNDVPEPASLALLGAGIAAAGIARRRKSNAK